MNRSRLLFVALSSILAVACASRAPDDAPAEQGESDIMQGSKPGGGSTSERRERSTKPPTSSGPACGEATCAVGEECCNASCGICVKPGGACTQQECSRLPDPEPKGPKCGEATCGAGEECCNPSCGICTKPGMACLAVECEKVDGGK